MFGITVSQAAAICGGSVSLSEGKDREVSCVVIDSRAVVPGCLFAAYRGEKTDGHRYIASALQSGAACALAEKVPEDANGPVIVVPDVQAALEKIMAAFRTLVTIPVIGIAGSVGKTSCKEMVSSVLSQRYRVHKTIGNLNNTIGLPVSLSGIGRGDEVAVLEMGINHFGEMDHLGAMAQPDVMLYTNIGHAHLEFLGDLEGVYRAKTEVLSHMREDALVIYNGDDPYLRRLSARKNTLSYGKAPSCDVHPEKISLSEEGFLRCEIVSRSRHVDARLNSFGEHMLYAALEGAAAGFAMGLSDEEIAQGIAAYAPFGRRFALADTGFVRLIDDCYNANPDSLSSSINSLVSLPGRHVCVLGEMLELGKDSAAMHRQIGAYAKEKGVDLLIASGTLCAHMAEGYGDGAVFFTDKAAMMNALPSLLRKGDAVLVKASLGSRYAEVSEFIKRMHRPCVFLDLDNTILDFSMAERKAIWETFGEFGISPTEELLAHFRRINGKQWELLEEGKITRRQVLVVRFEKLFAEEGITADAEAVQNRYESILRCGHYFVPGAEELLEALQGRYRLFLASNGNASTQDSRIASAGIEKYFENMFVSEKLGAEKPSREFFEACFARIPGFDASRAVMVGDSLTSDIRGGINAGLPTVWYNPAGKQRPAQNAPDYTISHLSELPDLLEKCFP